MKRAIIFDMDGTLIDNAHYHRLAWEKFCDLHGVEDAVDIDAWFGKTNNLILEHVFQRKLTQDEINRYASQKEAIYRDTYLPHLKPVKGLNSLLPMLSENGFKVCIATSAPPENVSWVLKNTGLNQWFNVVVDETMVEVSKPNPEIFIKAAEQVGVSPEHCLVFEDSIFGVKASKAARMKVIALTTSLEKKALSDADFIIADFQEVDLNLINQVMGG